MSSLTPQEAAILLGVTVRTLHRWELEATDVLEIITVCSARLYESRSHKNKKIVEELKEVASKL